MNYYHISVHLQSLQSCTATPLTLWHVIIMWGWQIQFAAVSGCST